MRIDPALRALRGNNAPQRAAQTMVTGARDGWLANPEWAGAFAEMDSFGAGAPLDECACLSALMQDFQRSEGFVNALVSGMAAALAQAPLAHVPFRHFYDGHLSSLILGRSGRAVLTLVAIEPGQFDPQSVSFSDGERHDLVLAGSAIAACVSRPGGAAKNAPLVMEELILEPGKTFQIDLSCRGVALACVTRRLVSLRLRRSACEPGPSQEYSLSDGSLLHQSAGDMQESRQEMMVSLLGRMGRQDAAPLMAQMAQEGGQSLRWQALRECLALDSAAGFAALGQIARNSADPLADPAGALRAQLLNSYPALSNLEEAPCHA